MTEVGSMTIYEDFKDRKTLTQATGKCFIWIPLTFLWLAFCITRFFALKFSHCLTSPFLGQKNLIFSDKVLIAFKKASVNFWGIILCLWLRINNPSKFCMSQLYIVCFPFKCHHPTTSRVWVVWPNFYGWCPFTFIVRLISCFLLELKTFKFSLAFFSQLEVLLKIVKIKIQYFLLVGHQKYDI